MDDAEFVMWAPAQQRIAYALHCVRGTQVAAVASPYPLTSCFSETFAGLPLGPATRT
jgi:hypothetical protein